MSQHINVMINAEPAQLAAGTTLRELISQKIGKELDATGQTTDGSKIAVAAAINGTVITRTQWHEYELHPGATIDVVTAAQGG